MVGRREGDTQGTWLDFYPVEKNLISEAEVDERTVFCVDIGGGKGHDLDRLHQRFPAVLGRLILQDIQKVVDFSPIFEFMVHDFFKPQPIIGTHTNESDGLLCRLCKGIWTDNNFDRRESVSSEGCPA